eukprot:12909485-Prorocentrum_lima.AAC.1
MVAPGGATSPSSRCATPTCAALPTLLAGGINMRLRDAGDGAGGVRTCLPARATPNLVTHRPSCHPLHPVPFAG